MLDYEEYGLEREKLAMLMDLRLLFREMNQKGKDVFSFEEISDCLDGEDGFAICNAQHCKEVLSVPFFQERNKKRKNEQIRVSGEHE